MIPILAAIAGPALGQLAGGLISKIVGDGPLDQTSLTQLDSMMLDKEKLVNELARNPSLASPEQLKTLASARSSDWETAYQQARGQLAGLTTFPSNSAELAHSNNAVVNHLNQAVADGAAMKQIVAMPTLESGRPGQVATRNQQFIPNLREENTTLDQLAAQFRSTQPYSRNLWNLSNMPERSENSWQPGTLSPHVQALAGIAASPSHLRPNQRTQLPSTLSQDWGATPIQLAPQPLMKLKTNQTSLTSDPTINPDGQSSYPTPSPAAGGSYGVNVTPPDNPASGSIPYGQKAQMDAPSFLGSMRQIGTTALNQLGGMAANVGLSMAQKASDKLVSRGGDLLSNAVGSLFNKIIGDAAPLSVRSSLNGDWAGALKVVGDAPPGLGLTAAFKVIGDAPPYGAGGGGDGDVLDGMGDAMTPAQASAATSNLANSAGFALMSQLVLEEQVLQLARGVSSGLDPVQLNRQLGVTFSTATATYLQSQVSILNGPQGCMISGPWYTAERVAVATQVNNWRWVSNLDLLLISRAVLEPPNIAPPLSGNTTIDTLKPLLLGASVAEYSSALRLRTSVVNIDQMLKAFSVAINNIEGRTGYSFATKLIKLLGLNLMKYQIPGINVQSVASGLNGTFDTTWNGGCTTSYNLPFHGGTVGKSLNLSVMTEWDYIDFLTGQGDNGVVNAAFNPGGMNSDFGVIFVRAQDAEDWQNNLMEIVTHAPWPMTLWKAPGFNWYLHDTSLTGPVLSGPDGVVSQVVGTRIDGCTKGMLFVVLGASRSNKTTVKIGPPDGDGRFFTLNTRDNGIGNPVAVGWTGDHMERWLVWLGSMDSVPATNTAIKKWEDNYGNNSDRSTALRFWADHSRIYGPNIMASNGVQVGSPQSLGGISLAFTHDVIWIAQGIPNMILQRLAPLDMPTSVKNSISFFNLSKLVPAVPDPNIKPVNSLVGWMATLRTASGLQLYPVEKGPNGVDPYIPVINCESPVTVLPTRDATIEFLCSKKWAYPLEEYPDTTLRDPARCAYTVLTLNNIMCSLYDMLFQATDCLSPVLWLPGFSGQQQTTRSRVERVVIKALKEMYTQGIQFPTSYNMYTDMFSTAIALDQNNILSPLHFMVKVYGRDLPNGDTISSVARIPREVMTPWAPILLPIANKLRLNFEFANPSKTPMFIGTDRFDMFTLWLNDDDCHLNSAERIVYNRYLARISQGVVFSGVSTNPGVAVINKLNNIPKLVSFNMRSYDESVNLMINQSVGRGALTQPVTSNICIPKVENFPTRDFAYSFSPLSLVMSGPLDAFGPGDGSFSYNMYYTNSGSYATITTTNFTVVPESVYSGSGVTALLSSF